MNEVAHRQLRRRLQLVCEWAHTTHITRTY